MTCLQTEKPPQITTAIFIGVHTTTATTLVRTHYYRPREMMGSKEDREREARRESIRRGELLDEETGRIKDEESRGQGRQEEHRA